jgi:hypothetical protein
LASDAPFFLQAVADQQQQSQLEMRERVTWGSTSRAAQASAAEAEALLHPRNAIGEPVANRAANAFAAGSIPKNIANDEIWGSPTSGG